MLKANQIPVFDSTDYVDCIEFKTKLSMHVKHIIELYYIYTKIRVYVKHLYLIIIRRKNMFVKHRSFIFNVLLFISKCKQMISITFVINFLFTHNLL
jgi:hypothetical protein